MERGQAQPSSLHVYSSHHQPRALFPGCRLLAKGFVQLQAPQQMGAQEGARAGTKLHTWEKDACKSVLHYLLVSYQTQEQPVWNDRNFLWRMQRVWLKSSPRNINYTSYANPSAKGGAQTHLAPTHWACRVRAWMATGAVDGSAGVFGLYRQKHIWNILFSFATGCLESLQTHTLNTYVLTYMNPQYQLSFSKTTYKSSQKMNFCMSCCFLVNKSTQRTVV